MANIIKCGKCNKEFECGKPVIEILNQLSLCAILINFANMPGTICTHCGQKYVLAIQAFDLSSMKIAHMALPDQPNQPSIVTAPAGFDPRKIIQ
jgi:hypothetical protein